MRPDPWLTAILASVVLLAQPAAPAAKTHAAEHEQHEPGASAGLAVAQADGANSDTQSNAAGETSGTATQSNAAAPANQASPANAAAPANTAAPANEAAPANAAEPAPADATGGAGSQEGQDALDAVQSGEAVPLQQVVKAAQASTPGELIDARLIRRDGNLVYEIKILAEGNTLHTVYYDARTGAPL